MNTNNSHSEKLFSYGTLRYETVQLATFGRQLNGIPDVLTGYGLSSIEINDPTVVKTSGDTVHPILTYTSNNADEIKGVVFDITADELKLADQYEVADYKRVKVQLRSGIEAWVYVSAHS